MKETLASQQIEAILSANWGTFKVWQNQNDVMQTFDMPQDVAQVFIPRRILELSESPSNVHVLLTESSPNSIGVLIYERLARTLTDPERLNEWIEQHREQKVTVLPSSQEESPEGVDYKHLQYQKQLESGELTFNDRVFIHFLSDIRDNYPEVVVTRNYQDRKEFQRKGIGGSFYQRLETVLKELSFKYLLGNVISPHAEFFKKQRIPYRRLPNHVKNRLPLGLRDLSSNHSVMVKIL